jgi:hypothetical protein
MPSEEDELFDLSTEARLKRFARRIINTRYFFIAFLLHVVLLALFGAKVIFEKIEAKGLFESESEVFVAGPAAPPGPPPAAPPQQSDSKEVSDKVSAATAARAPDRSVTRIATSKVNPTFNIPDAVLPEIVSEVGIKTEDGLKEKIAGAEVARLVGVRGFLGGGVTGAGGKAGATGKGRNTVAKFSCYVGKYAGADWDCNFGFIADKRWYSNCIYNLMLQISRWTKGNVKADLKPIPLELASREWIEKVKPPFIFITGHEDFVFDESEVQNLREYLMLGGALWVDSSLPGRRSRFDVALRREMKKVLPDRDFETIPNNHPLFKSYFEFTGPPEAMNYYKEPLECVKVGAGGGDIAVLYTLNAYSDLWETGLTEKDKIDTQSEWSPERQGPVWRTGPHYGVIFGSWQTEIFYRNVNEKSIVNAYRFGINIVIYLLTRYQDKLLTLPL